MNSYILSTERLGLRTWRDSDLEPFAEMNRDADVMKYYPKILTFEETKEMVQRIRSHFEKWGYGLFAVENKVTHEFIGYTGFSIPTFESFFTPCVEIGWRYKKAAWGQGFATEAATACVDYGFTTLHLPEIVSFTAVINGRSERVMERIGMTKIGEFNHPLLSEDNPLRRHVLYKIINNDQ